MDIPVYRITVTMVIGLLTIASIPTVIGVAEAISAQKSQNASLSKEQEKFHLAPLMRRKGKSQEAGAGVLVDNKVRESTISSLRFTGSNAS